MINVDPNSLGGEGANWADPRDAGHGVLENNPAEALQSGRSGPGAVRRLPTSTAQGTLFTLVPSVAELLHSRSPWLRAQAPARGVEVANEIFSSNLYTSQKWNQALSSVVEPVQSWPASDSG